MHINRIFSMGITHLKDKKYDFHIIHTKETQQTNGVQLHKMNSKSKQIASPKIFNY